MISHYKTKMICPITCEKLIVIRNAFVLSKILFPLCPGFDEGAYPRCDHLAPITFNPDLVSQLPHTT